MIAVHNTLLATLLTLVPLAALAQDAPPTAPAPIVTLDDAIRVALERHPTMVQARERLVRTRATNNQNLAARQPQISSQAAYTRLLNTSSGFGGGTTSGSGSVQNPYGVLLPGTPPGTTAASTRSRQAGGGGGGNNIGSSGASLNQASASLSVTQVIDITGVIRAAQLLGDVELQIQVLELEKTRLDIVLQVRSGYYNLLRSDALVKVSEAAVTQSEEQLRVTRALRTQGIAAEFDVLRARTQVVNNQQSLITARNQVAIAKNAFANSLGINPATPVAVTPPVQDPPPPRLDEEAAIEEALLKRPEARQVELSIARGDKNLRLARRTMEPTLTAGLSVNYNSNSAFTGKRETGSLGLVLTIPINDGGATRAQVAAARSDQRLAEVQRDQYRWGIQAEVQQAIIAVKDAQERQSATAANVVQAREAFRLAGVRYKNGIDTPLAVNDAQTALVQTETNAINARYDYLTALAQLTRALGAE